MKRIKYILLIVSLFLMSSLQVYATGSATVSVSANSTCNVGDTITVNIQVSNISGGVGVAGVSGNIKFDSSYFEYVSSTVGSSMPFSVTENKVSDGNYKIGGTSSTSFKNTTTVYTYRLKALKEGTTKVEVLNFDLSDDSDDGDLFNLTHQSKTITINAATTSQPKSSNATLSDLKVDGYQLTPTFTSNQTSYSIEVPVDTESINISATAADAKARVEGTGTVSIDGKSSVNVKVTAEDGTVKTYTINIKTKASQTSSPKPTDNPTAKSSDATLKKLDPAGYTLSPKFNKNTTSYTIKVGEKVDSLNIDCVPTDSKATVEITGDKNWKDGENEVLITVTAEDGTKKVYTLNVIKGNVTAEKTPAATTKPKSSNNYLKTLLINDGELSPEFSKNVNNYSITVPGDVDKLDLKAIAEASNAKVDISGNSKLKEGLNLVVVTVTAEDGTKRTYTINVTKSDKPADNLLDKLIVTGGKLSPEFNPNQTKYTMDVSKGTDKIVVNAIPSSKDATVEVIGADSLQPGTNTVLVKVTDKNGFVKYYEIEVNRKEAGKFLGLTAATWGKIAAGTAGVSAFGLLLFALFKKKGTEAAVAAGVETVSQALPKIEIKPEFNFNSKNGTDDDIVEAGGILNQYTGNKSLPEKPILDEPKQLGNVMDAEYEEAPYDLYDDVVTKDELYDAIKEAQQTKDTSKLEMLLEQERLNRQKRKLRNNDQIKK